jgi:iron complex outermembrane recepter protein
MGCFSVVGAANGAVASKPKLTSIAMALGLLITQTGAYAQTSAVQGPAKPVDGNRAGSQASEPADPNALQQVVVTAEKRGSTIHRTPISMVAVSGKALEEKGVSSAADIAKETAGVAVRSNGPGESEFAIRGMASTAGVSGTVGIYLDEQAVSPPSQATSGKVGIDPDLYDLERVEILRGPQGTLYGASSMGGTVKLVPRAPELDVFEGSVQLSGSKIKEGGKSGSVSAALNLPLAKELAALRLVATKRHGGGWIDRAVVPALPVPNPGEGGDVYSAPRGNVYASAPSTVHKDVNTDNTTQVRASVLIKPSADLTITPSFIHQRSMYGGSAAYDAVPGDGRQYQPIDVADKIDMRFTISSLKVNYDMDGMSLTSVTGYSKQRVSAVQDSTERMYISHVDELGLTDSFLAGAGGLGVSLTSEDNPTTQFTQELRLSSRGDGPWRWIAGAYYSRFKSAYQAKVEAPDGAELLNGTTTIYQGNLADRTRQLAVFGNVSYDLTPDLRATAGVRYFRIKGEFSGVDSGHSIGEVRPQSSSATDTGINPMYNLAYTFNDDHTAYATIAKGFREGAGQQRVPNSPFGCGDDLAALGLTDSPSRYAPDSVWNYELGSKNRFWNRRASLNVAVYEMRWNDVQTQNTLPTCGYTYVDNVGSAKIRGFEAELVMRLGGGLTFEQSLGYSRARYTVSNPIAGITAGDKLYGVPERSASSSLRYVRELSGDYSLMARLGAVYVGAYDEVGYARGTFGNYTKFTARMALQSSAGWSAALFIDNVGDKRGRVSYQRSLSSFSPQTERIVVEQPRTIGFEVNHRF